jgi:hypothetical protein
MRFRLGGEIATLNALKRIENFVAQSFKLPLRELYGHLLTCSQVVANHICPP